MDLFYKYWDDSVQDSYTAKEAGYKEWDPSTGRYYKDKPKPSVLNKEEIARRGKQLASALGSAAKGDVAGVLRAVLDLELPLPNKYPKRTLGTRMAYGKRSYGRRRTYAPRPRRKVYRKKPVSYRRPRRTPGSNTTRLIWKAMQGHL